MANKTDNLVPQSKRTKSEQRKVAQKGGKASGEARREKKQLRECAEFLLSLPVSDVRKFNKLARMGVPVEDIDNKVLLVAAMMLEGQTGNVNAFKEIRGLIGEDSAPSGEVIIHDDL